jgi:hypothetical protein
MCRAWKGRIPLEIRGNEFQRYLSPFLEWHRLSFVTDRRLNRLYPLAVSPIIAMLFSTVLVWLLIALAIIVALPALWLLYRALWPASAELGRDVAKEGMLKIFLLGLIPTVLGFFVVLILANAIRNGALAVFFAGIFLTWGFLGAGGIATLVGERLWPQYENEPWRQTQRGGIVLVCSALLPLIGWILILPLIAILGWGINLKTVLARRKAKKAAPESVVPA